MKTNIILIGSIILSAVVFAGCAQTMPATPETQLPVVNQTEDLAKLDKEIDNQNLDTDFPNLTQSDLEK
jgi:hypothetical protein